MAGTDTNYDYVIIGAGVAGANAVNGIREVDDTGTIGIFGAEPDPPVYRPDLSKTLWLDADATPEGSALLGEDVAAELRTDAAVRAIEPADHQVVLADGTRVGYGRLLLATGAEPRRLQIDPGPRVVYYRTVADYRRVRELARPGSHLVVVGGGYIGAEIASALTQNDVHVTMVIDTDLVQQRIFPRDLAKHVTDGFTDRGVTLVYGSVTGGIADDDGVRLQIEDGPEIGGDAVVIGVGVEPRTVLAADAGLRVDGGVIVDDRLRTSATDVYAAGDIATYPDQLLGERRVEHVDNAEKMGTVAGRNMAGRDEVYDNTPFFWSDLFDDGYEAIGETTTAYRTYEDWKDDDFSAGVVYYLDEGAVRGVLLWNVWDSVPAARDLIAATAREPLADPETLQGRIPLG